MATKINPNSFYKADALLSKKDLEGNTPEIFCVCGNRSGGKTTDFTRKLMDGWKDGTYREIMLLKRFANEIAGAGKNFLSQDFLEHFYPDIESDSITETNVLHGLFTRIYIGNKPLGWVVAINSADKVKKYSNLFNNVDAMFFDEFMPETGAYCPKEIDKFKSIHVSVAREFGNQARYVPVFMASNLVTLLNPYFMAWGIASRINSQTRFIRGIGLVVEQNYNKTAAKAQQQSAFLRSFGEDEYYTQQGVYLNDNLSMIGKLSGKSFYSSTIKYKGKIYGVRVMEDDSIVYCDTSPDMSFPRKIACTLRDIDSGFSSRNMFLGYMEYYRQMFHAGCMRFQNQECKDAIFNLLSYGSEH